MNPILKNILAIIAGLAAGMVINMGFIMVGHTILPIEGVDPNDMEALAAVMPTKGAEYFVFPFLAHAIGTLVGAIVAAAIADNRNMTIALVIGLFFLIGGVMVNIMIPGPLWFNILDLAVAYIPIAWIGGKIGMKLSKKE